MDELDLRLRRLFAEDEPPARDPAFQASVMAAVARRELAADLLSLAAVAGLGAVALGALWPVLQPVAADLGEGLAPIVAVVGLGLSLALILGARPMQALGLDS